VILTITPAYGNRSCFALSPASMQVSPSGREDLIPLSLRERAGVRVYKEYKQWR